MSKTKSIGMIQSMRNALNGSFVERQEIIDGMLVALLSKENIFLLGPPGTSKSALSNALCRMVGGKYFSLLLGKTTTPEELYGPVSFKALQEDRYERNTDGKLPQADLAFIDEIWKASSAINNSLLPIINEKIFYNGPTPQKIPLQMCVAASNETPQGEELGAIWDRFALRFVTQSIQDDSNFKQILLKGIDQQMPQFGIKDLAAEQAAAMALPVNDEVVDLLCQIRHECVQQGLYVSDRKWVQVSRIIRAQAYLNQNSEVQAEDLEILQHILWHSPDQISTVRKLVLKFCNPMGERLVEIKDALIEIKQNIAAADKKALTEIGIDSMHKLKELTEMCDKLAKKFKASPKIDALKEEIQEARVNISQQALGFM